MAISPLAVCQGRGHSDSLVHAGMLTAAVRVLVPAVVHKHMMNSMQRPLKWNRTVSLFQQDHLCAGNTSVLRCFWQGHVHACKHPGVATKS